MLENNTFDDKVKQYYNYLSENYMFSYLIVYCKIIAANETINVY